MSDFPYTPKEVDEVLRSVPLNRLLHEIETRFHLLEVRIPKEDEDKNKMYSVPEIASLCNVKISTVQRWVRTEKYPAKKIGRSYFFSEDTYAVIKQENGFLNL